MAATSDVASTERVIPAPPGRIFDLLADPSRHRDIDGSGTVRDAKAGSERLALEPVDGGTLVRETWDISQEAGLSKPLIARGRAKTVENMDKTLARIEEPTTA
jgi:hypothetical protein